MSQIGHALTQDQSQQEPQDGFAWHVTILKGSQLWVHGGWNGKAVMGDLWMFDMGECIPTQKKKSFSPKLIN
jgi:hypothetical protein